VAGVKRLGILGGTFDPIHHGHLVAAQEAHHQLQLDRVLFVPAGDPPHKPSRPISAARHRLRMVELAIAGRHEFGLSRVDVDRPGPHYTADTLALLREEWGPGVTLFFIEGTDALADLVAWHDPQRVIQQAELAVVERPGAEVDLAALEACLPGLRDRLHWIEMPALEISSTGLRVRVCQGRPISYLLPAAVEAYIVAQELYRPPVPAQTSNLINPGGK
jgi:nicotinate-nucleotide adenylyltransferase